MNRREYYKNWLKNNKDLKKKMDKTYYSEHKKEIQKYQKEYFQRPSVKERRKILCRKYHREHKPDPNHIRNNKLKSKFNITLEQYNERLIMQNDVCAICGKAETKRHQSGTLSLLSVDHDHSCCSTEKTCGKCIRGLICDRCNQLIARADDSIEILQFAIKYLEKYKRNKLIKIA